MEKLVLVYITNPSKEEARKIARHLLENKLIACAVILGGQRAFISGKADWLMRKNPSLLLKQLKRNLSRLKKRLRKFIVIKFHAY